MYSPIHPRFPLFGTLRSCSPVGAISSAATAISEIVCIETSLWSKSEGSRRNLRIFRDWGFSFPVVSPCSTTIFGRSTKSWGLVHFVRSSFQTGPWSPKKWQRNFMSTRFRLASTEWKRDMNTFGARELLRGPWGQSIASTKRIFRFLWPQWSIVEIWGSLTN